MRAVSSQQKESGSQGAGSVRASGGEVQGPNLGLGTGGPSSFLPPREKDIR